MFKVEDTAFIEKDDTCIIIICNTCEFVSVRVLGFRKPRGVVVEDIDGDRWCLHPRDLKWDDERALWVHNILHHLYKPLTPHSI
jgi:hypothetical protein